MVALCVQYMEQLELPGRRRKNESELDYTFHLHSFYNLEAEQTKRRINKIHIVHFHANEENLGTIQSQTNKCL